MKSTKVKRYSKWYLMLIITLVGTLVFNFYPLVVTFVKSLCNMKGDFIGIVKIGRAHV